MGKVIYCIKHKEGNLTLPEGYKELGVGKMFDGQGEHINHVNLQINELTGLYWIWKNTTDDIVGLCHYRRFFTDGDEILSWEKAKELVEEHELIMQNTFTPCKSLKDNLEDHFPFHYDVFQKYYDIFTSREPGLKEYLDGEWFNPQHIFVGRRKFVEEYSEWLFPLIVPIAEQFINEDAWKDPEWIYQRMVSYFSERLLTYYVQKNDLRHIEMPVRRTE